MNGLHIINKTKQKIPVRYFLFAYETFAKEHGINTENFIVNIIIVGKKRIQKLNNQYRGINTPTDVLSFPIDISDHRELKGIKKTDQVLLGDIYICPEYVDREILNYPETFTRKNSAYQYIFIHGLIHLIGYDHETSNEQKRWDKIMNMIWTKIKINQPS